MRLLAITDLHGHGAALRQIIADAGPVDVVLLGGDLTSFGSPDDAERILRLARDAGAPVLAVAGNCDSAEIDRRLGELGVSLHGRGQIHQDVGLHGVSAMPPWHSHMYQFSEEELSGLLRSGHAQIGDAEHHVVLSHPPPRHGSLDRTSSGSNVGSTALRTFLEETEPSLVFCGHVHEGRGVGKVGNTTVVNCGLAAAGYYALAEVGDEVNAELRRIQSG